MYCIPLHLKANDNKKGMVPRAYISLKSGFSITGEELLSWINARLEWKHR